MFFVAKDTLQSVTFLRSSLRPRPPISTGSAHVNLRKMELCRSQPWDRQPKRPGREDEGVPLPSTFEAPCNNGGSYLSSPGDSEAGHRAAGRAPASPKQTRKDDPR